MVVFIKVYKVYSKVYSSLFQHNRYGVELDLQLGQMTLRSRHLSALPSNVASHPDVTALFGDATIQASTIETSQHRSRYRLVSVWGSMRCLVYFSMVLFY